MPDELLDFCAGKAAVRLIEEGQPNYIEDAMQAALRRASSKTRMYGKDLLPNADEYTGDIVLLSFP